METLQGLDYNAVLRDIQYKPNFAYGAYRRDDMWWIRIVMLVENAREPFRLWEAKQLPSEEMYINGWDLFRRPPVSNVVGYSPSRPLIEVVGNYAIPYFDKGDEALFTEWVRRTLRTMELHELDEWFRYKGELVNDPHEEGK